MFHVKHMGRQTKGHLSWCKCPFVCLLGYPFELLFQPPKISLAFSLDDYDTFSGSKSSRAR